MKYMLIIHQLYCDSLGPNLFDLLTVSCRRRLKDVHSLNLLRRNYQKLTGWISVIDLFLVDNVFLTRFTFSTGGFSIALLFRYHAD